MQTKHAIVLLAGYGSRLRPLTDSTHKALIPVQGETILKRQIQQLNKNGITDFHLVLGYRAKDVQDYVTSEFPGLCFHFYNNEDYENSNNAYSLYMVLQNLNETFLLVDGDVVMSDKLVKHICYPTTESWLLCETNRDKLDAEAMKAKLDDKGHVADISKGLTVSESDGESIGVGLYQKDWATALADYLGIHLQDKKNANWYYEDAIQRILVAKTQPSPLKIISTGFEPWVEIDDHDDLARAQALSL